VLANPAVRFVMDATSRRRCRVKRQAAVSKVVFGRRRITLTTFQKTKKSNIFKGWKKRDHFKNYYFFKKLLGNSIEKLNFDIACIGI
jgi:hypothetical protein